MCGICGFVGVAEENLLDRMMTALVHRGPDDKGTYRDKKLNIGVCIDVII